MPRSSLLAGVFLFLGMAACAQPRYESSPAGGTREGESKQGAYDCSVRFKSSGLCVEWWWEKKPADGEFGSVLFKVFRLSSVDRAPIETDLPYLPSFILWMPSMGHGSSPTQVSRVETGTYRASQIFFPMPGAWEMRILLKQGDRVDDEAVVPVEI